MYINLNAQSAAFDILNVRIIQRSLEDVGDKGIGVQTFKCTVRELRGKKI